MKMNLKASKVSNALNASGCPQWTEMACGIMYRT